MAQKRIASLIRIHRKRSGFTQRELARLIGHKNSGRVSRHERGVTIPSLTAALGYETIFQVPMSDLFPAIQDAVIKNAEARLADLESALGQKSAKDHDANATARKLQFIWARKNGLEI